MRPAAARYAERTNVFARMWGRGVSTILNPNNRLFGLARQGRQPSALGAIATTLVTLVITIVGGQMLGRVIVGSIFQGGLGSVADPLIEGARRMLLDSVGFLPIYLCLWVWLASWSKRAFRTLGFERRRPLARALWGALVGFLMVSAAAAALAMLRGTSLERGQLLTIGLTALGGGLLTLLGTIVQESGEEVLFRGWLLSAIGSRYGPWIGVAVSSLLFCLAHALNPNVTLLGLLNLSFFGAFLALDALAEGGLWGACAWHTSWNWVEGDVFGLRDSGGSSHPALLIFVQPTGPNILTGGLFGPEGGLIQTVVLLIGIGIVAFRIHRDARHDQTC